MSLWSGDFPRSWRRVFIASVTVVSASLLSACGATMSNTQAFDRSSSKAIVVFGVATSFGPYEFAFSKFDPATQKNPNPFNANQQYDRTWDGKKELTFTASVWEPGIYAVSHYCYQRTCLTFMKGTYYYEVKAGQINYLGNYFLDYDEGRFTGYTDDQVKDYLKTFPKVDADLAHPERNPARLKGLWDK